METLPADSDLVRRVLQCPKQRERFMFGSIAVLTLWSTVTADSERRSADLAPQLQGATCIVTSG